MKTPTLKAGVNSEPKCYSGKTASCHQRAILRALP